MLRMMMMMMMMMMPQKHPGAETCAKRCWKKALLKRHILTRWDFLRDLTFETCSRCRLRSRPFIKICLAHPRRGPGIRLGCWADNFHQFNRETWTKCQCAEICADSAAQALLYMFSSAENSTNSSLEMMIYNEKTSNTSKMHKPNLISSSTHIRLDWNGTERFAMFVRCLCFCWDEDCLTPAHRWHMLADSNKGVIRFFVAYSRLQPNVCLGAACSESGENKEMMCCFVAI